jgi:hypothetical protein
MKTVIYFWRIKRFYFPIALFFMAIDKLILKNTLPIQFIKLLGTGKGETFTPKDADPFRWGLLATIEDTAVDALDGAKAIKWWRNIAYFEYRAILIPISSHGLWSGRQPFTVEKIEWQGKVAAITRARIVWRKNFKFWAAVPPVTQSLHSSAGLVAAIGIGEAPIGLQGTFSIWQNGASLREFAYQGQAHRSAIKSTSEQGWYSEELFSRFAVLNERGQI